MTIPVRLHRSELCVPGTSERMLEKAPSLGADVVMLDLEDAVAPDDKPQARENVIAALRELDWSGCTVTLRINGLDTHYCYRDIVDVVEQSGRWLDTVLIPKASCAGDIHLVATLLTQIEDALGLDNRIGISALIETAPGMVNVDEIAAACPERMEALIFGVADYAASIQSHTASIGGSDPHYAVLTDPNGDGGTDARAALGRPVALRAGADRRQLPRARAAADRRPVRRLQRSRGLPGRRAPGLRPRLRGQVVHPPEPGRAGQRGLLARRPADLADPPDHGGDGGGRRSRVRARSRSTGRLIDAASLRMAEHLLAKIELIEERQGAPARPAAGRSRSAA